MNVDSEILNWARGVIEVHGYRFGPHEVGTDYVKQQVEWTCLGCMAVAHISWPTWGEPNMVHDENCMYVRFMAMLDKAMKEEAK